MSLISVWSVLGHKWVWDVLNMIWRRMIVFWLGMILAAGRKANQLRLQFSFIMPQIYMQYTQSHVFIHYNEKSLLAVYHLFIKLIHRCMLECQHGWFCVLCSMLLLKCNWSAGLNCKGYSHQVNFSEEIINQCFGWWRSFSRTSPQALWIKHHNGRIKIKYQLNILWAPSLKAQICSFLRARFFV